ncbi:hypothetical protein ALNOE001_09870 [Candidatus Methanobinarius endosymbioticus]|uniref:Uncharacterized protein n=1 Tax=Candidatus Methanobinarius endosymbioticus TaxID=2006182 RepID=A0A366MB28_9EURY|nr:hypothetical protein ALNOE001_09870 [Candidatus Methanobinarius endosymbioticus]
MIKYDSKEYDQAFIMNKFLNMSLKEHFADIIVPLDIDEFLFVIIEIQEIY